MRAYERNSNRVRKGVRKKEVEGELGKKQGYGGGKG